MSKIFDKVISVFSSHPKGKENGTETTKKACSTDSKAKVKQNQNKKTVNKDKKKVVKEEHEFVDLGLPSGNLWAKCNIGAKVEYEFGDSFRFGEVEACELHITDSGMCPIGKNRYIDALRRITKYNTDSKWGIVDNKTELETIDDAATVQWGGAWRTPTLKDWEELYENCNTERSTSKNGYLFISKNNGNYIFFPMRHFAGGTTFVEGKFYDNIGGHDYANYMSSTLRQSVRMGYSQYVRDRRKKLPEVREYTRIVSMEEKFPFDPFEIWRFVRPIHKKS